MTRSFTMAPIWYSVQTPSHFPIISWGTYLHFGDCKITALNPWLSMFTNNKLYMSHLVVSLKDFGKFFPTCFGASCTAISDHNDTFVSCQFKNETFIHGIFNNLNQAGFSPQASSTLASTTFISVALWAAFFTISIFFFSTVNMLRSSVVNGQHVSSAVAGIKKGWSQIA